jgi:16S rRNA (guanine1207-N2)-methyltransferase
MERSSQIIVRNESRLLPGHLLLVNPPRDALVQQIETDERTVHVSTQDHGDFRWLNNSGASATFEVVPTVSEKCKTVLLHLPREKDRLTMLLHSITSWLPPEAVLWLVGENQAGIKSAGKYLAKYFRTVSRLDNARHCGLYEASDPIDAEPFQLADYEQSWQVELAGKVIKVTSLPGVFAHGRLDPGSELLLNTLERLQPSGQVLDFACGSGVIGCSVLSAETESELTLLDVSALAIESSRQSLTQNGLKAALLPSDGLSELEGRYDWIISNPPFHSGVWNDLDIAAGFFSDAGTFLADRGRIVIVCNRHLPYTNWLRNHFEQVELLDENVAFMIIQASKPRKQ